MFENIIGQSSIKNMLQSSIKNDKISHSYIFEGAAGMGKKLMAYTFAGYLVCETGNSCGKCRGCVLAKTGTHPDIITVRPKDGKKNIGVDDVRETIKTAQVKPYMAEKKIIILPDCDGITAEAQNAMLKVIEEPPEYIVFLILIQNSNTLLETVRSRSIKLEFLPYSDDEIKKAIAVSEINPYILSYCEGNIGRAKELVFDDEFVHLRNEFFEKLPSLKSTSGYKSFEIANFFESSKDNADILLDFMLSFFRDVLLKKTGGCDMLQNTDKSEMIEDFSDKMTIKSAVDMIEMIIKTKQMLSRNVNYSLAVNTLAYGSWEVIYGRNSRSKI